MKKQSLLVFVLSLVSAFSFGARVYNIPDTVSGEPQSAVTVEYLDLKISEVNQSYLKGDGYLAALSDFPTNSAYWTQSTSAGKAGALLYGAQFDYYTRSDLSFSADDVILTSTETGYNYFLNII